MGDADISVVDCERCPALVASRPRTVNGAGPPDADLLFLNVGRYTPQQAQPDLITAMSTVAQTLPDAHLCLVCRRGSLADDLRTKAYAEGVADHVTITGRVPSVAPYYTSADAYVSSSLNEGLPIVLLEAMAAGLPVVATDVPGNRDAVIDGETGILVPPRNPNRLAAAMEHVVTSGDGDRLGDRGFERVREHYSIQRTVAEYCSLYRDVAGRPSLAEPRTRSPTEASAESVVGNTGGPPSGGQGGSSGEGDDGEGGRARGRDRRGREAPGGLLRLARR
jgi:glycosyltransferase involved in cell wall biosynthesis